MVKQTKRLETGSIGVSYIHSELLKKGKNCFKISRNSKGIDLIIIDDNKLACCIDIKSTSKSMANNHNHSNYKDSIGKIGRWPVDISKFWDTYPANIERTTCDFPDFYIFYNLNSPLRNFILSGSVFEGVAHKRISEYLIKNTLSIIPDKHLCVWEFCEYCFDQKSLNDWSRLP